MAAFSPSWASETTSLTPRRPRRASLRKKSVQKVSASEVPIARPSTSRRPSPLTPTATITATETTWDVAVTTRLHIGRVQPDIGPFAFERTVEEGRDLAVDLAAQPADLALGDAGHAHRTDQLVDRARRDALDVGFLDHRRQRLLGHPARLEEAREVAALAQLRDAHLHRPGAGFPIAVAIPVAVGDPIGGAFAVRRAGPRLHLPP